ncbi:MAG TPA: hypothetical protein VNZ64_24185 [Candidatus Acidoferrum sp.]|nr:hypothetical protein [Candidatus Acidoferrum sp.]
MLELLDFVMDIVLDILCSVFDLGVDWRFYLPLLGSFAVVALIDWCVSNSGARIGLSAPVMLAGIATGVIWQARSG